MPDHDEITWRPTQQQREGSRLWSFLRWVEDRHSVDLPDYRAAHRWSVEHPDDFWAAVWECCEVIGEGFGGVALVEPTDGRMMPGSVWFPGTSLNWAENALRWAADPERADGTAVVGVDEGEDPDATVTTTLSWSELEARTAGLARTLIRLGVGVGDRVAAVLPNIPETIVAVLATASIGAIWTVNSPDLSVAGTLDRLRQLEPAVLIGIDGYRFGGKEVRRLEQLAEIREGLPTVSHLIVVRHSAPDAPLPDGALDFDDAIRSAPGDEQRPPYRRVPFDHPLWVLFSSGTTGDPKGIVHSHGGITVESYKGDGLQQDMGPGDRYYAGANTSWMVWNLVVNSLLVGSSVLTYSGSPSHGRPDRQLELVASHAVTVLGVGAAYLTLLEKSGVTPRDSLDFSRLRSIQSTGSPLPPSTWRWVHSAVSTSVHLGSDCGGTDICSAFIGSNPLDPVRLGELQGPFLGVAVEAWSDAGARLVGDVGEMVITGPLPSMPVFFWGDGDGSRYRSSYFERFPGVWTQGDWISETESGSFIVHGRSDATLNRAGVRLGSADVYAGVESLPEIAGSLVVGVELPDGDYYMPLFVVLASGITLDDRLIERVKDNIRSRSSARHVPDDIIEVPSIPVSHAGKRLEIPVKRLLSGFPLHAAVTISTVANPDSLEWYADFASRFREARL